MSWLSNIFFTAEKFIKKIIAITESRRRGSLSLRQLVGTNFDAGFRLSNDPTVHMTEQDRFDSYNRHVLLGLLYDLCQTF